MPIVGDIMSLILDSTHEMMSEDEFKSLVDNMDGGEIDFKEIKIGPTENMTDMIHRCLNCDAVAYEVGNGKYECPVCSFTWEVVSCG